MSQSPLHTVHESAGAEFQDYAGVPIVQTFGQMPAEYSAIRKSAGIIDFPQRGFLELSGPDRLAFLNNVLTNQTWDKNRKAGLPAGTALYSFLLNSAGRIVSDMYVLELGERTLLEVDTRHIERIAQSLDRYLFRERVSIASKAGELWKLYLAGPRAFEAIAKVSGIEGNAPAILGMLSPVIAGMPVAVYRDDFCGVPGYSLVVSASAMEVVWRSVVDAPSAEVSSQGEQSQRFAGLARPVGWAAFNSVRIEAGRPIFGIDYDDAMLPAETGQMHRAVSFTKGCYPGQEIVARMHARQQVSRMIVGIRMDGGELPIAGARIQDQDGNEAGVVTSSTVSPMLSMAAICLGIVKRAHAAIGTRLRIPAEGTLRAGTVVELPFVK